MTRIHTKKKTLLISFLTVFLFALFLSSIFLVTHDVSANSKDVQLINPLDTSKNMEGKLDIPKILTGFAMALLSFVGLLAFIMFVWGGFTWLTSAGRSEQVESGKKTLIWATVGMILAFASFLILNLLVTALTTPVPVS